MKYIIKNCPAMEAYCTCGKYYDYDKQISTRCKDITDCLLKRIADELNIIECGQYNNNKCELNGFDCCEGESKRKILQLLEIEEVDE